MPQYELDGISVSFPYDAYDCQKTFMAKVVASLRARSNALLESPTGTGKTLCLLCSTLSWIAAYKACLQLYKATSVEERAQKFAQGIISDDILHNVFANPDLEDPINNPKPRIFYASRTHSQLSQVIQELKNTAFKNIKVCVLGSRDQFCLNERVTKLPSNAMQTAVCRQLTSSRGCQYHLNVALTKESSKFNEIMDIEELVSFGKERTACPYYLTRENYENADIVFLPYNYLIDPGSRKAQKIDVRNSIVIFDEAHNLESSCNEATSFELSGLDLASCVNEAQTCIEISQRPDYVMEHQTEDFQILKALLIRFEETLLKMDLAKTKDGSLPGSYVYQFFEEIGVNFGNANILVQLSDAVVSIISQETGIMKQNYRSAMNTLSSALRVVFSSENAEDLETLSKCYKIFIQDVKLGNGKQSRSFSLWCFSSGVAMRSLRQQGCRSIILASGTLSPVDSFATEMQIPFDHILENPHIIKEDQVFISVVTHGPGGYPLNSSFNNRNDARYKQDLGTAIVNFCRIVPDGLLVFFPSYSVMEMCINFWKEVKNEVGRTVWQLIEGIKQPYVEPKNKVEFERAIDEFYSKIHDEKLTGAVFFAVCRGKASEGIDFSDSKGRAVVITGLPFPNVKDPKVLLKRGYLDDLAKNKVNACEKHVTGNVWYQQQAARAVNQAIGRVIRHKNDWGAILLCDDRFASASNIKQLPVWIRPFVQTYQQFGPLQGQLSRFLKNSAQKEEQRKKNDALDSSTVKVENFIRKEKDVDENDRKNTIKKETSGSNLNLTTLEHKLRQTETDRNNAEVKRGAITKQTPVASLGNLCFATVPHNDEPSRERVNDLAQLRKRQKIESSNSSANVSAAVTNGMSKSKGGKSDGKAYLTKLKSLFTESEQKQFQEALKQHKSGKTTVPELIEAATQLFDTPKMFSHLSAFKDFLPTKYHSLFAEKLKKLESKYKNCPTQTTTKNFSQPEICSELKKETAETKQALRI